MAKCLVYELNEADVHFIERYSRSLPMFGRMRDEGVFVETRIPWFRETTRDWRSITPWIIWPSIYTGMTAEEHGIVAFGQDTRSIAGRCVWDVLEREGNKVGVMGSLLSGPPRGNPAFYLPETLADDDACIPEEARPLQRFFVETARGYSERFDARVAARLALDLARSTRCGVRKRTVMRTLLQVPRETLVKTERAERANLQADIASDAFVALVRSSRPAFACMHSNHVAYMQHRYWRAAEPERFDVALSETDARFFRSTKERAAWESRLASRIEGALERADRTLSKLASLLDPDGVLLVVTGLGQKPFDPAKGEIHNPVVRLDHADELFDAFGVPRCAIRHQMNPDLSLTFGNEDAARRGSERITAMRVDDKPLFFVQQKASQVFLELEIPRGGGSKAIAANGTSVPLSRFLSLSPLPDESTAQHREEGFVLAWSPGRRLVKRADAIAVTDVAPTILSLFGINRQPWMLPDSQIAF